MSGLTELVDAMRTRGIIAADAPPTPEPGDERPWFLALLLGLAGWFAGVFVLVFLGLAFNPGFHRRDPGDWPGLIRRGLWDVFHRSPHRASRSARTRLLVAGQSALAGGDVRRSFDQALSVSTRCSRSRSRCSWSCQQSRAHDRRVLRLRGVGSSPPVRFLLRPGHGERLFFDSDRACNLRCSARGRFRSNGSRPGRRLSRLWARPVGEPLDGGESRALAPPADDGPVARPVARRYGPSPVAMLAFGIDAIGMRFGLSALFPLLSIALAMCAGLRVLDAAVWGC